MLSLVKIEVIEYVISLGVILSPVVISIKTTSFNVSKVAFNQAVDSVRAAGKVVAVGLPSETMDLPIVNTVLDGIEVIGSLDWTREDLREAFQFGAEGLVVPVVQTRTIEEAPEIFKEMEEGTIQGRMVIDMHSHSCCCGHKH